MHSLSRRLLLAVSVPLALFAAVAIVVLDTGFRALAERSLEELLDRQVVALIAAAEPQPGGGYAPAPQALDMRLKNKGSGLYAQIRSPRHQWRSPSAAGISADFGGLLVPGQRSLGHASFGRDQVEIESRSVQFADDPDHARTLTFSVAASLAPYDTELWRYRQRLIGWFGGLMLALIATLAALLHRVLEPLRRLERETLEVEEGRSTTLGGLYPRELAGVARNLNALLIGERRRVARYRDTLGNLAHSLKTPLAVMRASLPGQAPADAVAAEIDRMTGIIEHQLKRAAAPGGPLLGQAPVDVGQVAAELRGALLKVYAHKDLALEVAVAPGSQFVGDRGDLTELLGNLLDNACKWCRGHVRFAGSCEPYAAPSVQLELFIDDDGPGISASDRARVLERGGRVDRSVPGHGLGLAMVRETVELYGGVLAIETAPLGGTRIRLRLPGRAAEAPR